MIVGLPHTSIINFQQIMDTQVRVLILGGTNFMGKALLDSLCTLSPAPLVVCVNRGKIYWNNQARKQHPQVHTFYCDRKQHKDTTATIAFLSQHLQITPERKWSCVVDFSAFRWRDVQSVTKAIEKIAERYVFISSDSVYNSHATPFRDAIREEDIDLEQEYKSIKASPRSKDTYGYNKMKCELYLERIRPLPYVCLRLPDVIGPFDNTSRFWCTLKWIVQSNKYPLPITAYDERTKLSFVDSMSVAQQIVKIIQMGDVELPSKGYNLSSKETITNKELLDHIASAIGHPSPNYMAERNTESSFFYPSVQCGVITSQRAEREIGWSPIPLAEAIRMTAEFFHFKAGHYKDELKEMDKDFRKKVINRKKDD